MRDKLRAYYWMLRLNLWTRSNVWCRVVVHEDVHTPVAAIYLTRDRRLAAADIYLPRYFPAHLLAHEWRHVWQAVHAPMLLAGREPFPDSVADYAAQPSEKDANKFEVRFCLRMGIEHIYRPAFGISVIGKVFVKGWNKHKL